MPGAVEIGDADEEAWPLSIINDAEGLAGLEFADCEDDELVALLSVEDVEEEADGIGVFPPPPFEPSVERRRQPAFNWARSKSEQLKEERKELLIRIDIFKEHLPAKERFMTLKYLRLGVIELEDIADFDMYLLVTMVLRALRFQRQIRELEEASWRRSQQRHEAWLRSLG